jgi:hypothetical protein
MDGKELINEVSKKGKDYQRIKACPTHSSGMRLHLSLVEGVAHHTLDFLASLA